jgi:hypothetical protein
MTSATIRQARGASRGEGYGMIVFAAVLLGMVGFFNVIDGIAAIANSHIFIANAHVPRRSTAVPPRFHH